MKDTEDVLRLKYSSSHIWKTKRERVHTVQDHTSPNTAGNQIPNWSCNSDFTVARRRAWKRSLFIRRAASRTWGRGENVGKLIIFRPQDLPRPLRVAAQVVAVEVSIWFLLFEGSFAFLVSTHTKKSIPIEPKPILNVKFSLLYVQSVVVLTRRPHSDFDTKKKKNKAEISSSALLFERFYDPAIMCLCGAFMVKKKQLENISVPELKRKTNKSTKHSDIFLRLHFVNISFVCFHLFFSFPC